MHVGPLSNLGNWLITSVAFVEVLVLTLMLWDFQINDSPDQRPLTHGGNFSCWVVYVPLIAKDHVENHTDLIWRNRSPNMLKFFAWLLFRVHLIKHMRQLVLQTHCPFNPMPKMLMHLLRYYPPLPSMSKSFTDLAATRTMPCSTLRRSVAYSYVVTGLNNSLWSEVMLTIL